MQLLGAAAVSPERLCRYQPCHCQPPGEQAYCDASCETRDRPQVAEVLEEECLCGHPECRPRHAEEAGVADPS